MKKFKLMTILETRPEIICLSKSIVEDIYLMKV